MQGTLAAWKIDRHPAKRPCVIVADQLRRHIGTMWRLRSAHAVRRWAHVRREPKPTRAASHCPVHKATRNDRFASLEIVASLKDCLEKPMIGLSEAFRKFQVIRDGYP